MRAGALGAPALVAPGQCERGGHRDGHCDLHRGVLVWRADGPIRAISSASVGGGLVRPDWVVNVAVGHDFARTDLDAYVAETAAALGLDGSGCALLTAADVAQVQHVHDEGVDAWATVGVTKPTWAVRDGGTGSASSGRADAPPPGTINIVVSLPVPLTKSALVQAVGTLTEAKAQALLAAGVPGTGTASDAVVVACPEPGGVVGAEDVGGGNAGGDVVPFAGVRSVWGQRIARAVHGAVAAGMAARPWPQDATDPDVVW